MSLRAKLIVVTLFVGLVPLLVSAGTTLRIHQSAFDTSLRSSQRRAASQAASTVREIQRGVLRQFNRAAQALPWSNLSDPELRGALNILFLQDDGIAVVALLDDYGDSVVESVFVGPEDGGPHPTGSTELRARLYQASPPHLGRVGESIVGSPFVGDDERTVLVPILAKVEGRNGKPWIVTFAWSITPVCRGIEVGAVDETRTMLAHSDGRNLCPGPAEEPLAALPAAVMEGVATMGEDVNIRYTINETNYSAVATRPTEEWVLLVEQPSALAEAPSKRMFNQALFWLGAGLVIAISAGLFLAGGISGRVQVLAKGAEALGAGDLAYRITEAGDDELGRLGAAFNQMGGELEKRRSEIEAWNLTLQEKVKERTRELESAQKQLLESQKIAAVSSLAAGLAHEINNPLTGVLGLAQLMRGRFARQEGAEKTVKQLASIEKQAVRIREIVQTLLSLSQEESGGVEAIGVEDFVSGVVGVIAGQAEEKKIDLRSSIAKGLPDVAGDAMELRRAFMHLLKNSLAACTVGDQISIQASALGDDLVKIVIEDSGAGIAKEHLSRVFEPFFTAKKEWGGKGLGLTEAYRIIQQHHGRIDLQSTAGVGTVVSIFLPVYRGAHLL